MRLGHNYASHARHQALELRYATQPYASVSLQANAAACAERLASVILRVKSFTVV
ncbi:hypothetical protein NHG29_03200 [Aerococcaceae bacterium NML160702]|nr:hypothetical protein [Aerococcaceae bacterium NML160702]